MKFDPPGTTMPSMSSVLMPQETVDIAKKIAAQPLSKKQQKKLARAQHSETMPLPALPAATGHREKVAPAGDQLDPLIAWYSLVAKPIPRKQWASMPKAQAAVDAEREKLRECDGGRGTWDESTVCS